MVVSYVGMPPVPETSTQPPIILFFEIFTVSFPIRSRTELWFLLSMVLRGSVNVRGSILCCKVLFLFRSRTTLRVSILSSLDIK